MHACIYGPVSRVPESVSLGDHTIGGGGPGIRSPDSYIYIYIHLCVSCVILMFSRIHIQEAEVLSVRFPKEDDHINLAAKHPKLCTYFLQNSVYL